MLTAFGPIGRWKLAGGAGAAEAGEGVGLPRRLYAPHYQRFRHHLWLFIFLKGGL